MWKTEGLKQALDKYGFDAAFGGARRDEEKSRAKERIFSFRTRQPPLGPEEAAARAVVALQCPQEPRARASACSRSSNWTELDVWQYILREGIEIVPLYFAAPRPTVERDGLILMVDDERFPLRDGESAGDALGALPDAGLLSADGRGRERGGDASRRSSQEMLLTTTSRAAGPRDRPRRRRRPAWRRRSRRAISDGPRSIRRELIAQRHRRLSRAAPQQGAAALHHLRQRRRRQVDADRAAALRQQADLRRPAGERSRPTARRVGTQGAGDRFRACWSTGSRAEREQGITIDVAYRFFATDKRKFIVADTPGHEQYTRNMVTGASTADLAVLLVDARKGVLTQTRRHSYLAHLVGIRQLRAGGEQDGPGRLRPGRVRRDRRRLSRVRRSDRDRRDWTAIPVSGLNGDNIAGAQRDDALVRRAEPDRASRHACRSTPTPTPPSRSGCRCNGSTAPTRISAASPGMIASGHGRGRATRCAILPSGRIEHGSSGS